MKGILAHFEITVNVCVHFKMLSGPELPDLRDPFNHSMFIVPAIKFIVLEALKSN